MNMLSDALESPVDDFQPRLPFPSLPLPPPKMPTPGTLDAEAIVLILRKPEGITQLDFLEFSWRLAAVIHDLRHKGWPIQSDKTQRNCRHSVALYSLRADDRQELLRLLNKHRLLGETVYLFSGVTGTPDNEPV